MSDEREEAGWEWTSRILVVPVVAVDCPVRGLHCPSMLLSQSSHNKCRALALPRLCSQSVAAATVAQSLASGH